MTKIKIFVWIIALITVSAVDAVAESVDFETSIAPILGRRCLECHSANDPRGGLDLTRRGTLLAGGESGPAVVPGAPEQSYLFDRVKDGEMPPAKHEKPRPLPADEVAALRAWIAAGAEWPEGRVLDPYERTGAERAGRDWWSFRPIVRPALAPPAGGKNALGAIDQLIAAELERHRLTPAPPAEPRVLLRRLYFDLVGLPPSPDEVAAFEGDPSLAAYERTVDRLLASPDFGERWARYWLDVVRFAETGGYERDAPKPHAWKYRDWVIAAINSDKPFDRFVLEQLAGDELADRDEQTVIATGLLRLGTWDDEPNDALEYKYERLEDMVHVASTAFTALTFKCARCHDHKFDPIPQIDYYRLAAAFWPGPIDPRGGELVGGSSAAELGYDVMGWTDLTSEPPPLYLLKKGDPHAAGPLVVPAAPSLVPELSADFSPPQAGARTTGRRLQLARWMVDPRNPLTPRVAVNRLWQHHFGEGLVRTPDNFGFLGEPPTHPELLDWLASELIAGGWRLKPLHKMLVMSETYRQASQHPRQEVFDAEDPADRYWWRAARRRLDAEALRDAMLATSGELNPARGGPGFFPRLSAEALEGLSKKEAAWPTSTDEERRRRSIYLFTKRALPLPLMTTFDACDTTEPCGRRDVTTVPTQALALLNNDWVHDQSDAFARRLRDEVSDPGERITAAWRRAFGRSPSPVEQQAAEAHLKAQRQCFREREVAGETAAPATEADMEQADQRAWASLCHVLFNANEFLYID